METVEKQITLTRLQQTEGMSVHEIIALGLVVRTDWITFCNARYPDTTHRWKKRADGSLYFTGPIVHGYDDDPPDVQS